MYACRNRVVLSAIIFMTLTLHVSADHQAVAYAVFDSSVLKQLVNEKASMSELSEAAIRDKALARGHFATPCDITVATGRMQFRLKAGGTTNLNYTLRMSWPHVKTRGPELKGTLLLSEEYSAVEDWQKQSYVIVLKSVNLKK